MWDDISLNTRWAGLTSFGDQARAKVRANDVRLVFAWSSAGLRLIYTSLYPAIIKPFVTKTYKMPQTD